MRVVYSCILLALLVSCKDKNTIPQGIIQPEKMKMVFWDILRANTLAEEVAKKDSAKKIQIENTNLQRQVFAMHHISKEDFFKSYNFYTQHPALMLSLLDSTIAYAGKKNYNTAPPSGLKFKNKIKDTTKLIE